MLFSHNACLLINHAENGRKYLYDVLAIKKEINNCQTSKESGSWCKINV